MANVACYIDGFNLYHAIDALGKDVLKWLNLRKVCESLLHPDDVLQSVVYFTSVMLWEPEKSKRHKEYIAALRAVGVEVIESKFQKSNRYCKTTQRYCPFHEEKQTDVAFATRILVDCLTTQIDRVVLVTADSDQVPTIATIRALRPETLVWVACPPKRVQVARELGDVAHEIREISTGVLHQSLFPRDVLDSRGRVAARCPAKYQPPRF
jgi:uncharacterized LabA/DUF88 family protein